MCSKQAAKLKRTKAARVAALLANLNVSRRVVATGQIAAATHKNAFGERAAASKGVCVVAEIAELILFALLEDDVLRRYAALVFAKMAGVRKLQLVFDGDERRHAVRENGRKDRRIHRYLAVCLGYVPEK